ncbi:metallophosphoesterase [Hylemonella sp. W303a]|uniref:metallophosphoesterase n=1 Tax=Hylemonella sp. W303a TaxID=3389873 RepID=UPI00396B3925
MKIQLASDLHLEILVKVSGGNDSLLHLQTIIQPVPNADVLVLAGDIHRGIQAVNVFRDWPVPVIYVAGNHEFYAQKWEETRLKLRQACKEAGIHFLDDDELVLGGVRFLGSTLWTDFRQRGLTQEQSMREGGQHMTDYYRIETDTGLLTPQQTLDAHLSSRSWLEVELAKPFEGKTVVITHHAPHPLSVHRRFVGDALNGCFVSDLTPLLFQADLWLHGHCHDNFDYQVGSCRVVSNPTGYIQNGPEIQKPQDMGQAVFENAGWNPDLLITI